MRRAIAAAMLAAMFLGAAFCLQAAQVDAPAGTSVETSTPLKKPEARLDFSDSTEGLTVELFGRVFTLDQALDTLVVYGMRLGISLVILVIGLRFARWMTALVRSILGRREMSAELTTFVSGIIRYALVLMVIIMALAQAGVNVTSLLALFGAAGLAVGLAMKDTLSNFASGVMLLFFGFYRIGDAVNVAGVDGVVESLEIFNTVVRAPDGKKIIVPNSKILGGIIVIDETEKKE